MSRLGLAIVLLATTPLRIDATPCAGELPRPVVGELFKIGRSVQNQPDVPHDGARFIRPRLRLDADVAGDWALVVRDGMGRPVDVLDRTSFARTPSRWVNRVLGARVRFDLLGAAPAPRINLVEYVAMPEDARDTYYSIVNPASTPVDLYQQGDLAAVRLGDGVGVLIASQASSGASATWCCSGFALSDSLFLTNWHCGAEGVAGQFAWNDDVCAGAVIDFSWDGDGRPNDYACTAVEAQDPERDFAILRIAPLAGALPVRPVRLRRTSPVAGEGLTIVHHPACVSKRLSRSCTVRTPATPPEDATKPGRFFHDCGTNPGSSGAPIFDARGLAVGLHQDGQRFDASCQSGDGLNRGVDLEAILGHLGDAAHQGHAPAVAREITRLSSRP